MRRAENESFILIVPQHIVSSRLKIILFVKQQQTYRIGSIWGIYNILKMGFTVINTIMVCTPIISIRMTSDSAHGKPYQ